jgi:hypothetical protein
MGASTKAIPMRLWLVCLHTHHAPLLLLVLRTGVAVSHDGITWLQCDSLVEAGL